MSTKQYKLRFGKNAKTSGFGLRGCSHSMYKGGFDHYAYGIKGIVVFQYLHAWGSYHDMEI